MKRKKTDFLNDQSLKNLCYNIKRFKMSKIRVPEALERERREQKIYSSPNFQNLVEVMNVQSQESQ